VKLLFVASDPMEFAGLLRHCQQVRPVNLPVDWCRAVRLADHDALLAVNGVGALRAAAAVDAAGAAVDAIVSTGFCGALDAALGVADIVVADTVICPGREPVVFRSPAVLPPSAAPTACHIGSVCSLAYIARTAAEKQRIRASGAIAVEMEAGGVAARAYALGLPFFCIKAVTDLAAEDLANDFHAHLRSDGHFDRIGILRSTLRHPSVRLPELVRLRKRCLQARDVLGDFIARCRF
jgi:adenosylhomocysteine nucleosidase